jgi:hypothetical protein
VRGLSNDPDFALFAPLREIGLGNFLPTFANLFPSVAKIAALPKEVHGWTQTTPHKSPIVLYKNKYFFGRPRLILAQTL